MFEDMDSVDPGLAGGDTEIVGTREAVGSVDCSWSSFSDCTPLASRNAASFFSTSAINADKSAILLFTASSFAFISSIRSLMVFSFFVARRISSYIIFSRSPQTRSRCFHVRKSGDESHDKEGVRVCLRLFFGRGTGDSGGNGGGDARFEYWGGANSSSRAVEEGFAAGSRPSDGATVENKQAGGHNSSSASTTRPPLPRYSDCRFVCLGSGRRPPRPMASHRARSCDSSYPPSGSDTLTAFCRAKKHSAWSSSLSASVIGRNRGSCSAMRVMWVTRKWRYVGEPRRRERVLILSGEMSRKKGSREALTTTRSVCKDGGSVSRKQPGMPCGLRLCGMGVDAVAAMANRVCTPIRYAEYVSTKQINSGQGRRGKGPLCGRHATTQDQPTRPGFGVL
ncbi:hypothetical protein FJTKL_08828 [Diaporthe vaccinii]|uniref:Uncharacterized protein n=1 Tax=Diaporthe vaccinii TaxID=105482 RepID=A0ABR4EPQ4_9PEZI